MGVFDSVKQLNNLRQQAKKMQDILAGIEVSETSSSGFVKITLDGNMEVKSVDIKKDAYASPIDLNRDVKDTLSRVIKSAQKKMAEIMQSSGGLNLPGMS